MIESTRGYTQAEDRANTLSAALGLATVIGLAPFLYQAARQTGDMVIMLGAVVFCATLILVYLASTAYHALRPGPARDVVRIFDHSAIFLLIAGTYTPFAVGPLRLHGGWSLLSWEWGLAALGIFLRLLGGEKHRVWPSLIYVAMGWLGLFWAPRLIEQVSWTAFAWVLGGGLLYTIGIGFYTAKGRPHTHLIWHLFVFAGTCCHAYAIWRYAFL